VSYKSDPIYKMFGNTVLLGEGGGQENRGDCTTSSFITRCTLHFVRIIISRKMTDRVYSTHIGRYNVTSRTGHETTYIRR
jgi:hypothetical protein